MSHSFDLLQRPRRNRSSAAIRALANETIVLPSQLIMPLFLVEDAKARIPVASMPGIDRLGLTHLQKECEQLLALGVQAVVLFPAVDERYKDPLASYASRDDNFYLKAIRALRESFPELAIMTDVAMDPYSSDGHDGVYRQGQILNDETLPILGQMAVAQAQAGASIIGPSDMMDGRVEVIREALDEAGFTQTLIMSYTAKYASSFYGPFRDALDSAPKAGDKLSYQMHPANRREALREAALDEAEGADMLMVKPALAYLDIISDLRNYSTLPIGAYHVSGEYSMIMAAAERGWIDPKKAMVEVLTCIRRAGANCILTYFAKDYAQYVRP